MIELMQNAENIASNLALNQPFWPPFLKTFSQKHCTGNRKDGVFNFELITNFQREGALRKFIELGSCTMTSSMSGNFKFPNMNHACSDRPNDSATPHCFITCL
jgi:hypothetical protein